MFIVLNFTDSDAKFVFPAISIMICMSLYNLLTILKYFITLSD